MSSLSPELRSQLGQYVDFCNEHIEKIERQASKDDLTSSRVATAFREMRKDFLPTPGKPFTFSPSVLAGLSKDPGIVENLKELVAILQGESEMLPLPVNLDGDGRVVGGYVEEELRALQKELCECVAIKVNTTISNLTHKRQSTAQEHEQIKQRREEVRAANRIRLEQAMRRNTPEGALEIVRENGLELERLNPLYQNNKDIVLAAVTQNGRALQFAHPRLQNDNDVVRAALQHPDSDFIFQHVGEAFRAHKAGLLRAIRENEMAIAYGQDELVEDRAFIIEALRENPMVLQLLSEPLRNDRELVTIALARVEEEEEEMFIQQIVGNDIRPNILADRQRGLDVIEAVRNNHLESVRALLASGAISDRDRSAAVRGAARRGSLEMVHALLASGPISDAARSAAVRFAVQRGSLEMVQALLASGSIRDEARSVAVRAALRTDRLEIVRALLPPVLLASTPISDEARGLAVRSAAERGRLDIIQILLASGPISDEARGEAVREAERGGYRSIIDLLRQ